MIGDDDSRLAGQERYLKDAVLRRSKYEPPSPDWDHDHCEFCWEKFMQSANGDVLNEGYVTEDGKHWICPTCFTDFREMFGFVLSDRE